MDRFSGQIIHPQHWPEDLDYSGKKVVVIGSGATAITMVPAMAGTAAHVTMLQRTPTYIMPFPSQDKLANLIKRVLPADRAHRIIRNRYVFQQRLFWKFCQRYPNASRRFINWTQRQALPDGYPIDPNFNPPYQPWDQRLCVVPDGDLFKAISEGTATIVTDHVESFTETGIKLQSGKHLDADIVVTATGFNIQIAGGIELSLDGEAVDFTDRVIYRGTMLSGIPNFSVSIGYTNASWTLKVGILCEYFVKLLRHMDNNGYTAAWAVADPDMPTRPLLDFGAGYVQRALTNLPKQGPDAPWLMSRDYLDDRRLLRKGQIVDEFLHFSTSKHAEAPVGESVA
jgi:cation diffusion facilitator CzcD-associated flavoprotein CzcO